MTEPSPHARTAGTREPEKLAAGLDSAGIVAATKQFRELDTTTRVYARQWLIDSRHATEELAWNRLTAAFEGRVAPQDLRVDIEPHLVTDNYLAMTRLWTVAGEWKRPNLASLHRDRILAGSDPAFPEPPSPDEIVLVTLNSRAEHTLRNYGKLKLSAAKG